MHLVVCMMPKTVRCPFRARLSRRPNPDSHSLPSLPIPNQHLVPIQNRDVFEVVFLFLDWLSTYAHININIGNGMDLSNIAKGAPPPSPFPLPLSPSKKPLTEYFPSLGKPPKQSWPQPSCAQRTATRTRPRSPP